MRKAIDVLAEELIMTCGAYPDTTIKVLEKYKIEYKPKPEIRTKPMSSPYQDPEVCSVCGKPVKLMQTHITKAGFVGPCCLEKVE